MKYIWLLIVTLVCNNAHWLFQNYSSFVINFAYDIGQYALFIFVFAFIYRITPEENFRDRAISLVLALMFVNLGVNTIYDKLDIWLFYIQYPLGIILFLHLLISTMAWKCSEKVKVKRVGTYFVFKNPKGFFDFIITLFRSPTTSFSIISNYQWYKFSRENTALYKIGMGSVNWNDNKLEGYRIIAVPHISRRELEWILKTPWTLRKSNCVTAFTTPLKSIGIKLGRFDFIPSVFEYKFMRGKYDI